MIVIGLNNIDKLIKIKKGLIIIGSIISIIIIGLYSFGAKIDILNVIKYRPIIVISGSMEPTIKTYSVSIVKHCNIDDVDIGDIIVYKYNNMQIVHRVIDRDSLDNDYLVTKGDANIYPDEIRVTSNMIVGKVVKTYNNTASYLKDILYGISEDSISKSFRIVALVSLVVVLMILLVWGLIKLLRYLYIVIRLEKVYRDSIEDYKVLSNMLYNIINDLEDIESSKGLLAIIIKIKLISEVRDINESLLDYYNKVNNRAMRLRGLKDE